MDDMRNPTIAHDIWRAKYRFQAPGTAGESTLADTLRRVARAVAEAERPGLREHAAEQFFTVMEDLSFIPAGRILAGAGTWAGLMIRLPAFSMDSKKQR
jgi:ribonucleoside-diphosphate reductase alpha chain